MLVRLTTAFRAGLANAILGTGPTSTPTSAKTGNGAGGRPPQQALYDQAPRQVTLQVTRAANHEVILAAIIPPGQDGVTFDELGIFGSDGALLLHATLPAQTYAPGVEGRFEFTLNPEVYSD